MSRRSSSATPLSLNAARAGGDRAEKAGDADTPDVLTEFSRNLDKSFSFLEAHLQEAT
jgi:DNA-binding ferritin-like protein